MADTIRKGGASNHGDLTGLGDDDHTQYQKESEKDTDGGYVGRDANGLVTASGGGVQFPSTQSPSSDANALDDYEEGTFTPTILDDSLDPDEGQTYGVQVGRYTKIGNRVEFNLRVVASSFGTLTTSEVIRIGGLPFTSNSTSNNRHAPTLGASVNLNISAGESVDALLLNNATNIRLNLWDSASGTSGMLLSEFSADGSTQMSGQYEV